MSISLLPKECDQSQTRLHNCYILGLCNNCGNTWKNKMITYLQIYIMCNIYFEYFNKVYLTIKICNCGFFSKNKYIYSVVQLLKKMGNFFYNLHSFQFLFKMWLYGNCTMGVNGLSFFFHRLKKYQHIMIVKFIIFHNIFSSPEL